MDWSDEMQMLKHLPDGKETRLFVYKWTSKQGSTRLGVYLCKCVLVSFSRYRQRDASQDEGAREYESQGWILCKENYAAPGRQHGHGKLNDGGARRGQAAQRRVPD